MAANCKLSLLDLGRMDVDDGFFIRGATAAVQSDPHPSYERRRVAVAGDEESGRDLRIGTARQQLQDTQLSRGQVLGEQAARPGGTVFRQ